MLPRAFVRPLVVAIALAGSSHAWSAGAEVPAISTSSQGTSNANAAEANDASVIFYNPAGLARLHGTNISQPFTVIMASAKVRDTGTTRLQDIGQAPDTASSADCSTYDCMSTYNANPGAQPQQPAVGNQPAGIFPAALPVPALFASTPFNDMITVGLGVFSPGGGNLNYKADWFGRYFIDSAAIETVNINPSIGVRFDDKHSIGFGVSVLAGHAKFKEQIDVNKLGPYLLQPVLSNAGTLGDSVAGSIPLLGTALQNSGLGRLLGNTVSQVWNQLPDTLKQLLGAGLAQVAIDPSSTAAVTIETIGFGYGWNVGYMYQFTDKTRLSLSYRSKSDIRMNGDLDWDLANVKGTALGDTLTGGNLSDYLIQYFRPDTDARLIFTIPAKFNVGFFTELTDKLDFMASYTFNKTSVIKEITVELPNQSTDVKQGNPVIAQNWRDSFTAAMGVNYHWNDKLTLRTGVQFDQTPISSEKYRHPALADNDRWMGSVGLGYKIDKNTTLDLAYSYLYILPSDANFHETCSGTYYERPDNSVGGASECTANGGTFRAHYYDSHAHIFGLQLNKRL